MPQSSLGLCTHLQRLEDQPAFGAAAGTCDSLMFPLSLAKDAEFNILHGVRLFDHV